MGQRSITSAIAAPPVAPKEHSVPLVAMSCGKAEQSPETIATFKKLRQISANKMCFDCARKGASWASVHMGVFICLDCAGRHRQLGVHLSFVRSVELDEWTEENRAKMICSGNAKCHEYMKKKGGSHLNSPNELKQKYSSNAAQMYREQVLRDARAYVNSGQKVAVEVAPAPKKIGEGVDDFFSKLDGGSSIGRSASQNSLGARTDSNGSVSNMTSPSARRGSADDPAPMKSSRLPEDDWGDEDFTPTSASTEAAAPASPKPAVAVVAKARAGKVGAKKKKSSSMASKVTKVTKAAPAKVSAAKSSGGDDWGDMDGFDDSSWDKIKASSAQAEVESNRPPEQQFTHAVSPNSSANAADPEPEENEHAIKITNKSFSSGGGGAGHRVGSNIRGPPSRPPVSSAPIAVAAGDSSFKEKYAGQKSISSEQLEHATDEGPDERYSQFSGNTSLGSDQFYGNDEEATQSGSAGDMARKLAGETKQDVKRIASQAKAFVGNMISEYTR